MFVSDLPIPIYNAFYGLPDQVSYCMPCLVLLGTLPIFSKWCHISFEREMKSWMIYCAKVFPILLWYEQWLTGPHFGWLSSPYVLARKTTMSKTNSEKRRMNKIETLLTLARLLTCYVHRWKLITFLGSAIALCFWKDHYHTKTLYEGFTAGLWKHDDREQNGSMIFWIFVQGFS